MGHNKSGEIEINGRALYATNKFLNNPTSQLSETTVAVNQGGFDRAAGYYRAAWGGTTYRGYSHNSNYAVDTVIYGAGGTPTSDIRAPGFNW